MSWAEKFNSDSSGLNLSGKMNSIKLDDSISPAEIQARIKKHEGYENSSDKSENNETSRNVVQTQTKAAENAPQINQNQNTNTCQGIYQSNTSDNFTMQQQTTCAPQYTAYAPAQPVYYQPVYYGMPYYQTTGYQQNNYGMYPVQNAAEIAQTQNTAQTEEEENTKTYANSNQSFSGGSNLNLNSSEYVQNSADNTKKKNSEKLSSSFATIKEGEGIISSGVRKVASLFSKKGNEKEVLCAIEDFENGRITYSEAADKILKYEEDTKKFSSGFSDALSAASSLIGAVMVTNKGGKTGKTLAVSALAGALSKCLTQIIERSTNGIKGDGLKVEKTAADLAQGAFNGLVTGGAVKLTTDKTHILKPVNGSVSGAFAGSAIGLGNYAADCFTGDKKFSVDEAAARALKYGAAGAVAGGTTGGVNTKITNKSR